jgi:hypothetical protein
MSFPEPKKISPVLSISPAGSFCLQIPSVATFHIHDGGEIIVLPNPAASMCDVRLFLLGPAMSLLCHQKGTLPVLGACVQQGRDASVICGVSGSGKSTLAAALTKRGWSLICDGTAILDCPPMESRHASLTVRSAMRSLKLSRDALDVLGICASGLRQTRMGQNRFYYEPPSVTASIQCEVPLGRILVVESTPGKAACVETLQGGDALQALSGAVAQYAVARKLPVMRPVARILGSLAKRLPIYRLSCPTDFAEFENTVNVVATALTT